MFSQKDIADYYNTTLNHYEKWWDLKQGLSLHYGIWDKGIKTFSDSLAHTNKVMMDLGNISKGDRILDAGCGVGGAAIYLAVQKEASVTGITLSEKQVDFGRNIAKERGLEHKVGFEVMDYTRTIFKDESFDAVWACESMSSAPDHLKFIAEAHRVLNKTGKIIMSDFFLTEADQRDPDRWVEKWRKTWGVSHLKTCVSFIRDLENCGFNNVKSYDYTDRITKSAKRMFRASLLGAIPSEIYNLFHPDVSRFAKNHYKCGYFQYKALKENLWRYHIISAEK